MEKWVTGQWPTASMPTDSCLWVVTLGTWAELLSVSFQHLQLVVTRLEHAGSLVPFLSRHVVPYKRIRQGEITADSR